MPAIPTVLHSEDLMSLIMACTLFLGLHWLIAGSPLRQRIVALTGEKAFRLGFSLSVLASLIWMGWAYAHAPRIETWGTATALKPSTAVIMAMAFVFFIAGTFSKNISILNSHTPEDIAPRGLLRITRNPGLIGLGLWGLAHGMVNGDWASHWLFGTFAFQGLIGPLNMEKKFRKKFGAAWDIFAQQTSHWPFLAILRGRNQLCWREISLFWVVISLIVYALVLHYHARWFGVSPLR
jgi:uncharacterized membrane protein